MHMTSIKVLLYAYAKGMLFSVINRVLCVMSQQSIVNRFIRNDTEQINDNQQFILNSMLVLFCMVILLQRSLICRSLLSGNFINNFTRYISSFYKSLKVSLDLSAYRRDNNKFWLTILNVPLGIDRTQKAFGQIQSGSRRHPDWSPEIFHRRISSRIKWQFMTHILECYDETMHFNNKNNKLLQKLSLRYKFNMI